MIRDHFLYQYTKIRVCFVPVSCCGRMLHQQYCTWTLKSPHSQWLQGNQHPRPDCTWRPYVQVLSVFWIKLIILLILLQDATWLHDLTAMHYVDPLHAPSPAVQATISSIVGTKIHEMIQTTNRVALLDKDDDGDHSLLLLTTLDLSH
jgi:hypothetical protein